MARRPGPRSLGLGVLAIAGVGGAVAVVGTPAATQAREQTVTVKRGVVQSTVSGTGNLSPASQRELSFGAAGTVTKIYVEEGQHVGTGQLLARIDQASAKVDLAEAQAALATAQDALDTAQSQASAPLSSSGTELAAVDGAPARSGATFAATTVPSPATTAAQTLTPAPTPATTPTVTVTTPAPTPTPSPTRTTTPAPTAASAKGV